VYLFILSKRFAGCLVTEAIKTAYKFEKPGVKILTIPEENLVHCNMPWNEQVERDSSLQSSLVNSDGEHNATSVDVGLWPFLIS
ncbi:hypothetical protein MKW92_048452, partial [Papaver armeniacum]